MRHNITYSMAQQDDDVLTLDKLDLKTLRDSALIGLISTKGGGKTTVLKNLLHAKQKIPAGVCFTSSGEANGEYDCIFPKMFMYDTCNLAQFEEIYKWQTTKNKKCKRKFSREEKAALAAQGKKIEQLPFRERYVKNPTIIAVLEDMLSDKKLFNKPIIRDLAMNGRHKNIFAVITCQYLKDLPPPIRQNIDYWFIFKEDNDDVRHEIYDMFCKTHIKTYKLFKELMDIATSEHRVLFIDVRETSLDPKKKFKWYRADINLPAFRVGCDKYWRFAKKNFKEPDAANAVIVNKYASRIAGNTHEKFTQSQLEEIAEREAMMQDGGYNKKRKRNTPSVAAIVKPFEKKSQIVLLDDEPAKKDVSEPVDKSQDLMQEDVEEDLEELSSRSKRPRRI